MIQYMDHAPTPTSYRYKKLISDNLKKINNLFAINMYTVVYMLCQKANPYAYMHVQYAYALYTYTGI